MQKSRLAYRVDDAREPERWSWDILDWTPVDEATLSPRIGDFEDKRLIAKAV
ncbi:MAG: hypothetical protein QS721_09060 [Candidatus Endonucleobacter sp. (ex Gigantidas childressi)]|nr:hypothetical protein [Candidatus Endonucleobacter sp. (ex Gigantidas childressi)]